MAETEAKHWAKGAAAPRGSRPRVQRLEAPALQNVTAVVLAAVSWALSEDWIAAFGLAVLWAGWRFLPRPQGPPVLALAYTFQWLQVTSGLYYFAFTGRALPAMESSSYRSMILLGLGCLLALLVGLRLGAARARRPSGEGPRALTLRQLLTFYVAATVLEAPVQELAWRLPLFTQAILALSFLRLGLLFLIFRELAWPKTRLKEIAALLVFEVLLGFTRYFAGFREPLMMLGLVWLERFDRRRTQHWVAVGGLAALTFLMGLLWLGIRTDYRKDFELDAFASSRTARIERIGSLSGAFVRGGTERLWSDLDGYVDRLWAIYYPALALDRVPAILPHEHGRLLRDAIVHIFTPRVLFPEKGALPSDSEMVRTYSGIWVAGEAEGTSIAFGYAIESYVDFGVPLMFLPVLAWGLVLGRLYRLFLETIHHRDLAIAFVTVVFWLSVYLFERSWIKWLGLSLTMMIYMGGAVLLLDRLVLSRGRGPRLRGQ